MKLTSSGRTLSAAMMRSPSFSRSSSSMITAILPRRRSSRISSMVLNPGMCLLFSFRHEPLQIAGDHVYFYVDTVVHFELAQSGHLQRVRNDIDVEAASGDVVDGQADAVDANRTLGRHEAHQGGRQLELQAP